MKRLFDQFLESEAKGGVLLFVAALAAFTISNSPAADAYFALREVPLAVRVGDFYLEKDLHHFVNDFLMAIFFLLVGLELKRELLTGELREPRRAALAIAAALGGMAVPALIYTALNAGGPGAPGWGIPMATDIAFALGVVALLGRRVPLALKVFLTALAIVDDLGAVLVIALFYTSHLGLPALFKAGLTYLGLIALGRLDVRSLVPYLGLGLVLWFFLLKSGVHATVAGVLLAFSIPIAVGKKPPLAAKSANGELEDAEAELEHLEAQAARAQSPLHRLEHLLHPWVAYGVLPVFAFVNAGVSLSELNLGPIALGAFLGLLLGKPAGILLFSYLAVRAGLARLPVGVGWNAILGAGAVAGIGFTMALFIAGLAFDGAQLDQAKVGVLFASVVAALLGAALLARSQPA